MTADTRETMRERLYRREPVFSFEFFPPKDEAGEKALGRALDELTPLHPAFISVTCGAGGSTRGRTGALVGSLQKRLPFGVVAHIVGRGSSRAELAAQVRSYREAGIRSFLALRGDAPRSQVPRTVEDEPAHADEVVRIVRANAPDASIGVAGYPEGHPESPGLEEDIRNLSRKMEAGADFVVTQMFFENEAYFHFQRLARKNGVRAPILPGIMPVTRAGQIEKYCELTGKALEIPEGLRRGIHGLRDNPDRARELGVAYCAAQCADLLRRNAPGIHFFTLNQSRACHAVYEALRAMGWAAERDDA